MAEKCLSSENIEKCLGDHNDEPELERTFKNKINRCNMENSFGYSDVTKLNETSCLNLSSSNSSSKNGTNTIEIPENSDIPGELITEIHDNSIDNNNDLGESASHHHVQRKNIEIYLETPALDQIDSTLVSEDFNTEEPSSSDSARGLLEEDTTSSCSHLLNLNSHEACLENEGNSITTIPTRNKCLDKSTDTNNVCGALYENELQSMDAIERRDFQDEKNLTGGVVIKTNAFNNGNQLNLELLNKLEHNGRTKSQSENKTSTSSENNLCATPTTSRCGTIRMTKSAAKMNLCETLDKVCGKQSDELQNPQNDTPVNSNEGVDKQQYDLFVSSNSNDSLSSEKSCTTSSNHSLQNYFKRSKNSEKNLCNGENDSDTTKVCTSDICKTNDTRKCSLEPVASTSSHPPKCQYSHFCCETNTRSTQKDTSNSNESSISCDETAITSSTFESKKKLPSSTLTSKEMCTYNTTVQYSTSSLSSRSSRAVDNHFFEPLMQTSSVSLRNDNTENDFDDETWADCDEGSEEEVCTCYNYSNDYTSTCVEDELPSRDVDLSGYIQLVTISEDVFLNDNVQSDTPNVHRKRKLNENRVIEADSPFGETTPGGRKRIALDCALLHKNISTPTSQSLGITSPTSSHERRTPRSLIPTKDNPPPELSDWLLQFQRWSHAERLLAVDRLIEHCEPTQVRHMMKVIEPQFQRDFISLLPKELALQVLSYLEPKDLLRAAQTCRSWRFLCDDNLLWKEKCKQAQIVIEPNTDRPKRGRAGNMPPISSPWKAAFMRQHIIEMNWRSRPIRQPKVLKGHDDHVITCLQFCGNRIVSGSDDNTLKVWSAITGKCLRTLVGHTGGVWSSQMSGNIIISGSTDRTLKVWNVDTGQCIHTLLGHTSTVRCMHLHGSKVVSGSRDATLRVWDIEQGSCLHVLVGHLAAVRCVQYDGKLIVSGAYDYMVKVWNPERQECLHTLQGHTNRVYSLQFDGIHVVSGSLDTSIRVWDVETGSCKHTLTGHQSLTSGMELRQNILVSGNADSTVKVWDITTGQCLQTLSGPNKHQSAVTCLQFNSRFVITSSDDGTVKLWDVRTGEFIRNLVALDSGGSGGVVWRIRANDTKLICAIGSRNGTEETKLMILDFDVEGACLKCS